MNFAQIVPISALVAIKNHGPVRAFSKKVISQEGVQFYPEDQITNRQLSFFGR